MKIGGKKTWFMDYLMIIIGTGLMALAISSVFDTSGLVTGGFSGAAIIIKEWTKGLIEGGVPLWVTNLCLNVPLFFIGWKIRGFGFVRKAIVGEISLSAWLAIQPAWNIAGEIFFWLPYTAVLSSEPESDLYSLAAEQQAAQI